MYDLYPETWSTASPDPVQDEIRVLHWGSPYWPTSPLCGVSTGAVVSTPISAVTCSACKERIDAAERPKPGKIKGHRITHIVIDEVS